MKKDSMKIERIATVDVYSDMDTTKESVTGVGNAPRVFNIETGLIGAGFFAKCGSVYTGGWSTERKAFNAARALLRKRNPDAIFKHVLN